MVTKDIEKLLNTAHQKALEHNHSFLLTEHLLYAICISRLGADFLDDCGVDIYSLHSDLGKFFHAQKPDPNRSQPVTSVMVERIIKRAVEQSLLSEQETCSTIDVLVAMMREEDSYAVSLLKKQDLTRLRVMRQSRIFENIRKDSSISSKSDNPEMRDLQGQPGDSIDSNDVARERKEERKETGTKERKGKFSSEEKIVREYLIDLNEKSRQRKVDPLIGRDQEMGRLLLILGRRKKNNPILVGDPGVGKTAIVEGLAKGIVEKTIHKRFHDYQVYSLEVGSLLAGTKFRGDFEERMTKIFEILKKKRNCIVFIDEIHTLVGAGATTGNGIDASNLIKPMLTGGEVQVIGATTFEEYRNHFQKDAALNRRFEKVEVPEPSIEETVEILKSLAGYYEDYHQVCYSQALLENLPILCKNYFLEKQLPDGAIDIMDLAGSHTKLKKAELSEKKISRSKRPEVSLKEAEKLISRVSGIPLRKIEHKKRFQINEVVREIKRQVFGQDHVIEAVIKAVKLSKLGLSKNGPIGSFLFTGPTGVGKTELCRVLSRVLDMHLVRLDMSEFMESHSVSKLIGAPPGYVGFNERSGELTEQIHRHPHSVLLLDEIEKAHNEVVNTFLQVMDYGRLTDSSGRRVSFENTLIVMTSNLGAEELSSLSMGFSHTHSHRSSNDASGSDLPLNYHKANDEVKRFFRPEFRNRLNAVLPFNFLSEKTIRQIIAKLVNEINTSLSDKNLLVELEPEVVNYLLKKHDPQMGGRSINRVFETKIKEKVADYVFSSSTDFFKNNKNNNQSKIDKSKTNLVFFVTSDSSIQIRKLPKN